MMETYPEIYAWVIDDPTGKHGIIAFTDPNTGLLIQAVSTKRDLIKRARGVAEQAAQMTGLPVQLRRYGLDAVLDEIKP